MGIVPLDIGSRTPSLRTVSRVGDAVIFTFSSTWSSTSYSSIYFGQRKGHHIEQVKMLSNSTTWQALSATVHGHTVYIGERNQSALNPDGRGLTGNARIRSIDLSTSSAWIGGSGGGALQLKLFLPNTASVNDLSTMPASCVPLERSLMRGTVHIGRMGGEPGSSQTTLRSAAAV